MATISSTYNKSDIEKLAKASKDALRKISNLDFQEFFSELSLIVLDDIDKSFKFERDPYGRSWQPLKPSTLRLRRMRKKNSTKILEVSGKLRNSIQGVVTNKSLKIQTNVRYAGIHQYGNPNNKLFGNPAPIPQRKFLPLNDSGEIEFPTEIDKKINQMIDEMLNNALGEL